MTSTQRYAWAVAIVALIGIGVISSGCSPKFEDATNVVNDGESTIQVLVTDPDSITIYRNADSYPNIGVVCINGDALIFRSQNWNDMFLIHQVEGTHNLCAS